MTLNWATQVSFEPKLLGISVEKHAFTHELIEAGGVFSLCIIDREDRAIVRKFTQAGRRRPRGQDAQRLPVRRRHHRRADPHPVGGLRRLSRSTRPSTSVATRCSSVRSSTPAFLKPEDTPVLRMEDTRMSYGG